jgi:hypothetical protein
LDICINSILTQKLIFFNHFGKIEMRPRGETDIIFVFGTKGRGSNPLEGILYICMLYLTNMKKIFLIILLGSLLFPFISSAGTYKADGTDVCYEGLVPCGKEVYIGGSWEEGQCIGGTSEFIRCQFCHFFVMLDEIVDFVLFQIVPPLAILMLVIGGAMFMFAHFEGAEMLPGGGAGGPKMLGQAKKLITSVVIGLIIIFAAWIIIDLFFSLIGLSEFSIEAGLGPREWNKIQCTIELPE